MKSDVATPEQTIAFLMRLMRGARAARGLTLQEFGGLIGVSKSTIQRAEQGKTLDAVNFLRVVEWFRRETA